MAEFLLIAMEIHQRGRLSARIIIIIFFLLVRLFVVLLHGRCVCVMQQDAGAISRSSYTKRRMKGRQPTRAKKKTASKEKKSLDYNLEAERTSHYAPTDRPAGRHHGQYKVAQSDKRDWLLAASAWIKQSFNIITLLDFECCIPHTVV